MKQDEEPLTVQETAKLGKIVGWAVGILVIWTTAIAFIFATISRANVSSEIKDLRLELATYYARAVNVVDRKEFDSTIIELRRQLDKPVTISTEADTRLKMIAERVQQLEQDRALRGGLGKR